MATDLRAKIAGFFQPMSHASLDTEPNRIAGLEIPRGEGLSKSQRIDAALEGLSEKEMACIALKLARTRGDVALEEAGLKLLEANDPPLTRITRRDVARVFGEDLAGEADLLELVSRYFVIADPWEDAFGGTGKSLRDRIDRHMVRNPGDWSVEFLFGEIGAFDCSRARFAALLQETVHPLARSGEEQRETVVTSWRSTATSRVTRSMRSGLSFGA